MADDDLEVDPQRLKADVKYWNDEASWWAGILVQVSDRIIQDSGTLIRPFLVGYNQAVSDVTHFVATAPDQLATTANAVQTSADKYVAADHDAGKPGIHKITGDIAKADTFKGKKQSWGSDAPDSSKPSVKATLAEFDEDVAAWRKNGTLYESPEAAVTASLDVLQAKVGGSVDLNPFDGSVEVSTQAEINLIMAGLSGRKNLDGLELAAAINGSIGASASGSVKVDATQLAAKADAFAGAKGTLTASASAAGVTPELTAGARAGLGAGAHAELGMGDDGRFHIGLGADATLGVGLELGVGVTVDPDVLQQSLADGVDRLMDMSSDIANGNNPMNRYKPFHPGAQQPWWHF